jgi:xanthine dehydrogenase large subunit
VKFGISFTATWYNQAGALVHVYQDGSIHLNHGGTEMGQGLNTKVAQVVAEEFQVDLDTVKITATTTGKVPNTSATAASSGTDLNGMAAANAAQQIKTRLVAFAAEKFRSGRAGGVRSQCVRIGNALIPFGDLVIKAYMARIQLSAAGFYKTPDIHWDRATGKGRPFYYFAYGAAVSEVSIDTLTGEYQVDRTDMLHDVGVAEPGLDIGQIEGAFIQGMGWLTTEELVVGRQGPTAHPRALDLQDPAGFRPAEDLQRQARRLGREPRADDPALEGCRRTAVHAADLGARGARHGGRLHCRLPGLAAARCTGDAGAGADGGRTA